MGGVIDLFYLEGEHFVLLILNIFVTPQIRGCIFYSSNKLRTPPEYLWRAYTYDNRTLFGTYSTSLCLESGYFYETRSRRQINLIYLNWFLAFKNPKRLWKRELRHRFLSRWWYDVKMMCYKYARIRWSISIVAISVVQTRAISTSHNPDDL